MNLVNVLITDENQSKHNAASTKGIPSKMKARDMM